jgi:hypothetical protein
MSNLCSITSLGILGISDICRAKILEKSDECEFLFALLACADVELLVQVIRVSRDFFVRSPLLLVIHQLIDGRPMVCGLGAGDLNRVPLPDVFAILVACS